MREADIRPFTELLDATCSMLSRGSYVPNATHAAMYFRALSAYELDDVRAAFDAHVRDADRGRFVPTPADILKQINGDAKDQALIAWGQVLESVRSGSRGELTEPARKAVQSLGGLSVIGRADETQNSFLQRQFVEAFKAYRAREIDEREALPLAKVMQLAHSATKKLA